MRGTYYGTPYGPTQDPPLPEPTDHSTLEWYEWRYGPGAYVPSAGTEARREWIGKYAPMIPLSKPVHLHALYNRGRVQWVMTTHASSVCRDRGRCVLVRLNGADINARNANVVP